jgi:N-methylhydantoinase B
VLRDYRMLADDVFFGVRSDKSVHAPHGLQGGHTGAPAQNRISASGGAQRGLPPMPVEAITLNRGDVYRHVMAGGGGFGDPHEREPARVREDVLDGKVTAPHARAAYAVVVGPAPEFAIDQAATLALRAARSTADGAGSTTGAARGAS